MARGGFSVTISATDAASGTIDKVNKRLAALRKPVDDLQAANAKLSQSLGQMGRITGVTPALQNISSGMRDVAHGAGAALGTLSRLAPALGALTAAGTVAGVAALASQFGSFGQHLLRSANRAGIMTDRLQELENGAQIAGAAAGAMTSGVTTLRDNLVNAVGGRAPEFVGMMTALGLAWRDAAGHALDVNRELPIIFDVLSKIEDPTLRARAGTALLGGAYEELAPMIAKGAAGLAEYTERARAHGVMNREAAERASKLAEAQRELSQSAEGLANSVALKLSPAITPLLAQLSHWIDTSPVVAKGIHVVGDEVKFLGENVNNLLDIAKIAGEFWLIKKFFGFGPAAAYEVVKHGFAIPGLNVDEPSHAPAGTPLPWSEQQERDRRDPAGAWWRRTMPPWLGGSPDGAAPGAGGPGTTANERTSANDAMTWFRAHGYDMDHAAAMAANIRHESDFVPHLPGDSGTAMGLFQWRGDRRSRFTQMYGHDLEHSTPEEQYAYADWELHNTERAAGDRFFGTRGPQAGGVLSNEFERPQDRLTNYSQRTQTTAGYIQGYRPPVAPPIYGPPVPPFQGALAGAAAVGPSGQADMTINLRGFPPDTVTSTSATGDIWAAPPRVVRSLPGAG